MATWKSSCVPKAFILGVGVGVGVRVGADGLPFFCIILILCRSAKLSGRSYEFLPYSKFSMLE